MKKEEKQKLIDAFKKSNKERRQKLAKKAGFSTPEAYLTSLQGKTKTVKVKGSLKSKKEMLDYVVAFDTTGSMSSYISDVKKHVEKLIPEMFSQDIDLKMKIIAFGDYCDMTSEKVFGKAYQESQLTDNQNDLISFVRRAQSTGGGDGDEFYELVIKKITEETPWRDGAKKAVLFIADCNPHKVGYSYSSIIRNAQIDWRQEAKKAAEQKIAFDTLSIHGDEYKWYKELSNITNGVYMPFKSSNKMSEVFKMSAYARGSAKSKTAFFAGASAAMASGDSELIGTYKSLSKLTEE